MNLLYFINCDGKLFSTSYEKTPVLIASESPIKLVHLERIMIHNHSRHKCVTNRFENLFKSVSTKVDTLKMSSHSNATLDLQNSEMVAFDIKCKYDWIHFERIYDLHNSALFLMEDFGYSDEKRELLMQGEFVFPTNDRL